MFRIFKKWTGLKEYYPVFKLIDTPKPRKIRVGDTILSNSHIYIVEYKNGQFYPRCMYLMGQNNRIINTTHGANKLSAGKINR